MNLSSQSTALVLTIKYITTNNQLQVVKVRLHRHRRWTVQLYLPCGANAPCGHIGATWQIRLNLCILWGPLLSITDKMFLCN